MFHTLKPCQQEAEQEQEQVQTQQLTPYEDIIIVVYCHEIRNLVRIHPLHTTMQHLNTLGCLRDIPEHGGWGHPEVVEAEGAIEHYKPKHTTNKNYT